MAKPSGGVNNSPKPLRQKIFGANSLQMAEDDASSLVGSIVEKGISEGSLNRPLAPSSAPRPSVLPFPVAHHRSHGPHWTPTGGEISGHGGDAEDDIDAGDDNLTEFDSIAAFANPLQRKDKKGLDLSRWRELMGSDNSLVSRKRNDGKHVVVDSQERKNANEVAEISNKISSTIGTSDGVVPRKMSPDDNADTLDVRMEARYPKLLEEASRYEIAETREVIMDEMEPELLDGSKGQRRVDAEKQKTSASHITPSYTPNNMGNEQGSTSLESQIEAENRTQLQTMSADEIIEAQTEILEMLERKGPGVIAALRRRGQDKLKKLNVSSSDMTANGEVVNLQNEKKVMNDVKGSPISGNDIAHNVTTAASTETRRGLGKIASQNSSPGSGSLWDAWSETVEAVRELRFSMEGNVVEYDIEQVPKTGNLSTPSGYTADNVSERDFLRTEGDPAAAGYTIKEAVALTRSVIPGQRALALHLLAAVLDKTLLHICQNQSGYSVKSASINRFIDWGAIWAYTLGPEPELALALRICLDDNHTSVVLACMKVIQCILSCDANESYFDISEKIATYPKDLYTAPVFRSRPEIDGGFLQGGFWKYNAKPSKILPFSEDVVNDKTEGEHTIQEDIVVAGQDFVAGLVRMGILPRIRYLLETDPSAALEESIISILVAVARHSPTCANAIMKCQRLVQTLVDRFTTHEPMKATASKIKSVTLLKVLARSGRKNCIDFVKSEVFRKTTWHLYQYVPLDQWLRLGKKNCKHLSALIVEQLRFWKVCIQYGYCVSYFSDFFPGLCIWLNVPTFEELMENNVLSEFAAISNEVFLVLGALTRRLPNFYSDRSVSNPMSEVAAEDVETWCWVHVGPMVDLALKWTALRRNPYLSEFFEWQNGCKSSSLIRYSQMSSLLWVISAVMHMLSGVLDRVIPEDATSLPGGHLPWLPEFVPKIGHEIIKNRFLSFPSTSGMENGNDSAQPSSFIEYLCHLRHQGEQDTSIASVCCLHGVVKVVVSVDKLIHMAKAEIHTPSQGHSSSREDLLLAGGIVKSAIIQFRSVLSTFMNIISSVWQWMQSIETFGRGGPAPGVGVGWGAVGGGFWSKSILMAQTDAESLIALLELFEIESANDLPTGAEMNFAMERINSCFAVCLIAGPRNVFTMDKALDNLLQVPVLKYFDQSIRHFIRLNKGLKPFGWNYKEEDFQLFSKVLATHFRSRWLTVKKKLKEVDRSKSVMKKVSKMGSNLDSIQEDLEMSDLTSQDNYCTSLAVEWAQQRLPLPVHWFLSPISTINGSKRATLLSTSDIINPVQDVTDYLQVAKGGIFFLLGIEVVSSLVSMQIQSPVWSVPITWKLHSLSVTLLFGMGVLEEEKSRDVYEALQEVYGYLLDELWFSRSKEFILEDNDKLSAATEEKCSMEFLRFQSEIHESYSTFVETLVEQFAAVSYGDLLYGRQVAIYLHRGVETSVRLAAWNALSNARVLELLPPLENCFVKAEGYLEPVEDDEGILEAYVKSWVSGALDRAATRGSVAFKLVLHHLASFVFSYSTGDKLSLRNKLIKSLLRDYSRKQQHEEMMVDLIQYQKTGHREGFSSTHICKVEKRFELLTEACEGNSTLLHDVEKLRLSFEKRT